MVFFVLFAFAAIVIDIGIIRLACRQLQNAADAGAIEGLRFRDDPRVAPADRDAQRRLRTADIVAIQFDDDLNVLNGDNGGFDDGSQFGAGPLVNLAGGAGDSVMAAGRQITLTAASAWKPALQSNAADAQHGDMVSGRWDPAAVNTREQADYSRADFFPGDASATAFLVRLRRTPDFDGLDNQAGVSSGGPALPFLFARGTLMAFADPANGYSPRHHGVTVRGTGIAAVRPAASIGRAQLNAGLPGGFPIAVPDTVWTVWTADVERVLDVDDLGGITDAGAAVGFVIHPDGESAALSLGTAAVQAAPAGGAVVFTTAVLNGVPMQGGIRTAWLPISGTTSLAAGRVVGFGCVEVAADPAPGRFRMTKRTDVVAWANASSTISRPLASLIAADVLTAAALVSAGGLQVSASVR
jgi:hypothetical protein